MNLTNTETMSILKYGFIFTNHYYSEPSTYLRINLILKDIVGEYTYQIETYVYPWSTTLHSIPLYGSWAKNNKSVSLSTLRRRYNLIDKSQLEKSIKLFCKDHQYI